MEINSEIDTVIMGVNILPGPVSVVDKKALKDAEKAAIKAAKDAEKATIKAAKEAAKPKKPRKKQENTNIIINKGTGAGGAKTNYNGKNFEEKTINQQRLIDAGYTKNSFTENPTKASDFYLTKTFEDKTITFVLQNGLKKYMKNKYNIEMFRYPDEAYIVEYNSGRTVIKILEKKKQTVDGSVETKLWAGPSLKREYEIVLGEANFEVFYGFCVSEYFKTKLVSDKKKYTILGTILNEHNITVLFGDDKNYFQTFDSWFNNSL